MALGSVPRPPAAAEDDRVGPDCIPEDDAGPEGPLTIPAEFDRAGSPLLLRPTEVLAGPAIIVSPFFVPLPSAAATPTSLAVVPTASARRPSPRPVIPGCPFVFPIVGWLPLFADLAIVVPEICPFDWPGFAAVDDPFAPDSAGTDAAEPRRLDLAADDSASAGSLTLVADETSTLSALAFPASAFAFALRRAIETAPPVAEAVTDGSLVAKSIRPMRLIGPMVARPVADGPPSAPDAASGC